MIKPDKKQSAFATCPLWAVLLLFLLGSCSNSHTPSPKGQSSSVSVATPVFHADSAFRYVAEQVAFGPRVPGSPAHANCASYLAHKLEHFGASVMVQESQVTAFDGKQYPCKNIIGQFQPDKNDRILLFAHWDSRPFADHDPDPSKRNTPIDGASDGASGVGVLLEMARQFQTQPPSVGVDIIFFDVEDMGTPDHLDLPFKEDTWCLGSQYWGQNTHKPGYSARYGILLDMVGAKGALFFKEQYSMQMAPQLVELIWNTAARLGFGNYFVFSDGGTITDDHYYVYKYTRIPCVDIIQFDPSTTTSFGSYWHTHADNMDIIDPSTLHAVGQTLLEVIYKN